MLMYKCDICGKVTEENSNTSMARFTVNGVYMRMDIHISDDTNGPVDSEKASQFHMCKECLKKSLQEIVKTL